MSLSFFLSNRNKNRYRNIQYFFIRLKIKNRILKTKNYLSDKEKNLIFICKIKIYIYFFLIQKCLPFDKDFLYKKNYFIFSEGYLAI